MLNHPFYSINTNVYDESFCTAAPTNLNGQNVIVSQEKQRKLYDTLNTSVQGYPSNYPTLMQHFSPGNYIQAQKQYVPGGVAFSFNTVSPQPTVEFTTQRMYQPDFSPQQYNQYSYPNASPMGNYFDQQQSFMTPRTLEEHMAMNALKMHGLQSLEYQRQLARNPYQLKFHHTKGTSCTSLLDCPTQFPGSRSTPDFNNLSGIKQLELQTQLLNNFISCTCKPYQNVEEQNPPSADQPLGHSNHRRQLVLSEPPSKIEGHVADVLEDQSKRKVSFCLDKTTGNVDKSEQASLSCSCTIQDGNCGVVDVNKQTNSCNEKGKQNSGMDSSSSEPSTNSGSSKSKNENNGKRKRKFKRKRKSRVYSESDSE